MSETEMWQSQKLIIVTVLVATVLLVGSAGVALAKAGSVNNTTPGIRVAFDETGNTDNTTLNKTLLARVAAILGIDQQKLDNAFTQARQEMQSEALDKYLKKLVDQGKITQQQADQYKTWWQSRPNLPNGFGLRGRMGLKHMRGHFPHPPEQDD